MTCDTDVAEASLDNGRLPTDVKFSERQWLVVSRVSVRECPADESAEEGSGRGQLIR